MRQARQEVERVKLVQRREFARFDRVAPALLAIALMLELFVLAAVVILIVAFVDDDDLPGPRRCFAHATGNR